MRPKGRQIPPPSSEALQFRSKTSSSDEVGEATRAVNAARRQGRGSESHRLAAAGDRTNSASRTNPVQITPKIVVARAIIFLRLKQLIFSC